MIDHSLTTTTFTLDGYEVTKTLGVVRGITVRSRSVFGTIGASLQTLVGGKHHPADQPVRKTRNEAFTLMLEHASALGATRSSASATMRPR
jgi:uncharacterized protein YbjQ (UPF0145 family)